LPAPSLASLEVAFRGLNRAVELFKQGERTAARQAVVDAYLEGVEPVEPRLRARDPNLVSRLEASFTRTRLAADGQGDFEKEALGTVALLERARGTGSSGFWSIFVAALLILLREGFEAVIVVGALLAVLKKMKAPTLVRVVHLAWVSALVFGVVAFLFGQALFAGANREWLESLVALGAVGLLVYAAFWLSARAGVSRFMTQLRAKTGDAVEKGSVASLFIISFTSVGRESVETALFLEGLATDSRDAVLAGGATGLVALFGLVLVIRAVGFRLPMKTLFAWSTVLLLATAVMLLGKGLHGLQELGVLPLEPVRFVTVDALGLFPDLLSLGPQLLLALVPIGVWLWRSVDASGSGPLSNRDSSVS
jgi:high-affinity iron transporter